MVVQFTSLLLPQSSFPFRSPFINSSYFYLSLLSAVSKKKKKNPPSLPFANTRFTAPVSLPYFWSKFVALYLLLSSCICSCQTHLAGCGSRGLCLPYFLLSLVLFEHLASISQLHKVAAMNHSTFRFPFLFLSLEPASEYCVIPTSRFRSLRTNDDYATQLVATLLILEWNRWTMLHVLQHTDSLNLLRGILVCCFPKFAPDICQRPRSPWKYGHETCARTRKKTTFAASHLTPVSGGMLPPFPCTNKLPDMEERSIFVHKAELDALIAKMIIDSVLVALHIALCPLDALPRRVVSCRVIQRRSQVESLAFRS
ncbi:hypothetical protein EDD15DRAFT_21924 [Pisolithus albus]|nr:hypothetical protein EDD15DRAFT_21924 [Pisolithus albus]